MRSPACSLSGGEIRRVGMAAGAAGSSRNALASWELSRTSTRCRKAASPPQAWSRQAARCSGGKASAAAKMVSSFLRVLIVRDELQFRSLRFGLKIGDCRLGLGGKPSLSLDFGLSAFRSGAIIGTRALDYAGRGLDLHEFFGLAQQQVGDDHVRPKASEFAAVKLGQLGLRYFERFEQSRAGRLGFFQLMEGHGQHRVSLNISLRTVSFIR